MTMLLYFYLMYPVLVRSRVAPANQKEHGFVRSDTRALKWDLREDVSNWDVVPDSSRPYFLHWFRDEKRCLCCCRLLIEGGHELFRNTNHGDNRKAEKKRKL